MSRASFSKAYKEITNLEPMEMTFTIEDADLDKLNEVLKDINVKECPWFEVQDKHGNKARYYRESHWIPCSERLPEKDEWDNAFLVTIQCEHVDGWEDYYVSGAEYSEYGWEYTPCPVGAIKVVAWMIVSISPYQPAPHCTDDYCEIEEEAE